MVFVKFHNMKQEKKISNVAFKLKQLTNFYFTTSQNNIAITVHKCSAFFSFLFFFIYVLSIFLKNVRSFLSFFLFFYMLCSTVFKFPFFSSLSFFCTFFFFFFFFFIINCSFNILFFFFFFFKPYLCLYLNSTNIGSLPSLFNFNP